MRLSRHGIWLQRIPPPPPLPSSDREARRVTLLNGAAWGIYGSSNLPNEPNKGRNGAVLDSDRCNFNSDSLLVNDEAMEADEADEAGKGGQLGEMGEVGGAEKTGEAGEEGEEDSLGSLFTVKDVENSDSIHVYMVAQVRLGKRRGGREGFKSF